VGHLDPLNCSPKNVRVLAVIVAELKLRNIERHIFGADLVERANDPAFEDRPEALNRIRVKRLSSPGTSPLKTITPPCDPVSCCPTRGRCRA
jgi:hypothetical protein